MLQVMSLFYVFGMCYIYTFHICIFLYFSSFRSMTYCIPCTITYIISYTVYISCLISCSGYTPMLYFSFLSYSFIIYLHIHTCTIIYFHVICFHLVLFIYCHHVLFVYFIYICTFLFYHILCAFVYFMYFSCVGLRPILSYHIFIFHIM